MLATAGVSVDNYWENKLEGSLDHWAIENLERQAENFIGCFAMW